MVFIVGVEEGIFPHNRALNDPVELEEERRLAYVGITRAKEQLVLSHAWSRSLYGSTQYNPPSRFLSEIPDELIQREGSVDSGADSERYSFRSHADRGYAPQQRLNRNNTNVAPVSTAQQQDSNHGFRIGDDIEHPTFGEGVIIEIRGSGEKAEATIRFRLVGTKHLSLAWAPLKKLN